MQYITQKHRLSRTIWPPRKIFFRQAVHFHVKPERGPAQGPGGVKVDKLIGDSEPSCFGLALAVKGLLDGFGDHFYPFCGLVISTKLHAYTSRIVWQGLALQLDPASLVVAEVVDRDDSDWGLGQFFDQTFQTTCW